MLNASSRMRQALAANHTLLVRGTLTLADGTRTELSGSDLMAVSAEEATSSDGSFDIGAAIIGSATVTLQNFDRRFDSYDFTGSSIAVWLGKSLTGGTTEWLRRGTYWVDQPDSYGGTIELSCLDALSLLERPWADAKVPFPATLGQIVSGLCAACSVSLDTPTFPNSSYRVASDQVGDGSTCLDVLGWAAQAAGLFARATPEGHVALGWYDTSAPEGEVWLDGGTLDGGKPSYSSGDAADGGTLDDYSSGRSADGGTFDAARGWDSLYAFSKLTVNTDDVVITGVEVTASDGTAADGSTVSGGTTLSGKGGYVLAVSGNPLVLYGQDKAVADRLAKAIVGMRFRPFSGTHACDPCAQAGDFATVTDRRQNVYGTFLTRVSLAVNGSMQVECSAKSASRNSAERAGAATSAYVAARKEAGRMLSSRDLAIRDLGQRLGESSGLYSTDEKLSDGSVVHFLHDRPTVAESRVIWKMTAEAVAVSTDGGKTYATGLSANGDAVLNRIYAIGIDADHITTGRLSSRVGGNYIDLDTGEARLALGASSTVGGSQIATKAKAIASVAVEYASSTSQTAPPTTGWSATAPAWASGRYVWQRTVTTMQDGTRSTSAATCISGANGANGKDGTNGANGKDGSTGPQGPTGTGVSAVVPEYYLSTSDKQQAGGSWSTEQPAWSEGHFLWTRSRVTWTDKTQTTTAPVLAAAINSANESVSALDRSLDQKGTFDRLTNHGALRGIYMEGGEMYVNADFIQTGRLQDSTGKNYWDMSTGEMNISQTGLSGNGKSIHLASDGIEFLTDGHALPDMTIKSGTCTYASKTKTGDGSLPLLYTVHNGIKQTTTLETDKRFLAETSDGKAWYSASVDAFVEGNGFVRRTVAGTVELPGDATEHVVKVIDVSTGSRSLTVEFHYTRGGGVPYPRCWLLASVVGGGDRDVSVDSLSLSHSSVPVSGNSGGDIYTTSGARFLSNENFGAVANGGDLFSGKVTVTRASSYGGTTAYINHDLTFKDGLLVDFS